MFFEDAIRYMFEGYSVALPWWKDAFLYYANNKNQGVPERFYLNVKGKDHFHKYDFLEIMDERWMVCNDVLVTQPKNVIKISSDEKNDEKCGYGFLSSMSLMRSGKIMIIPEETFIPECRHEINLLRIKNNLMEIKEDIDNEYCWIRKSILLGSHFLSNNWLIYQS